MNVKQNIQPHQKTNAGVVLFVWINPDWKPIKPRNLLLPDFEDDPPRRDETPPRRSTEEKLDAHLDWNEWKMEDVIFELFDLAYKFEGLFVQLKFDVFLLVVWATG